MSATREPSWLFGADPRSFPYLKGGGRDDDGNHDGATDNPMSVVGVVIYVATPIFVRFVFICHNRRLGLIIR
jgi:hypothetical protein